MADEKLENLKVHVAACSICSSAKGRANDFCEEGLVLFLEYAQEHPPTKAEMVEITREQYERLLREARRRRQSAERN